MADEVATEGTPVVEESLADFVARENALERGDTPEPEPTPDPEPDPEPEAATDKTPAKKTDGRTLEGRRQKQYEAVKEVTGTLRETERQIEARRAELAAIDKEISERRQATAAPSQQQQPPQQRQPVQEDLEPKIEDFKDKDDPYTAWVFARNAWGTRQEIQKFAHQNAAQQAERASAQAWHQKIAGYRERDPQFDAKLNVTPIDIRVWPFIQNHPQGGDIAAYLTDNLTEAQRLLTLHPIDQIGRIGEIVAENKARSVAAPVAQRKPTPISQAKDVIQPLTSQPVAAHADIDPDTESLSAFIERENRLERKAGRR